MDRSEVTFRYAGASVYGGPYHDIRCSACGWHGDYLYESEAEAHWASHVRRAHDESE